MVTVILIILLIVLGVGMVVFAARRPLAALITRVGTVLALPFTALMHLLERLCRWLSPIIDHTWQSLWAHRGIGGRGHLVLDAVVSVFMAVAVFVLGYTELALTALTLGPLFTLPIPFGTHDIVVYLSWSFLVAIAVLAFAAWELRPHHDPENAPPVHVSALGEVGDHARHILFLGYMALLGLAALAAICGSLYRLQALAGSIDWGAAGIFLAVYALCVGIAMATATIIAIRSIVLLLVLAGEALLVAAWLLAAIDWIPIRIIHELVGVAIALVDLGHSLVHAGTRAGRNGEEPESLEREPISPFVEFPDFIFRRHWVTPTRTPIPDGPAPGTWSDAQRVHPAPAEDAPEASPFRPVTGETPEDASPRESTPVADAHSDNSPPGEPPVADDPAPPAHPAPVRPPEGNGHDPASDPSLVQPPAG